VKIILGQEFDSGSYPDALGVQEATMGDVVVGPSGLVGILETRLGLSKDRPHEAVRIGHYLRILKDNDNGTRFYSKSLEADAWSTAKTILTWRDELKISGWNGEAPSGASERLKTLSELEEVFRNELIEGMGDRLQAILAALNPPHKLDIQQIQLVESRKSWPSCWNRVFDSLNKSGVLVTEISPNFPTNSGDLNVLQRSLEPGNDYTQKLTIDGSLCVMTAPNEWEACEAIASFLEANQKSNEKNLIIRGGGSSLLDETLSRHNLPRLGYDSRSRWRTALQVLPLVLANYWEPFDAQRLLEFLVLPKAPISRKVRSFFADAIREHPGINGPKWDVAINKSLLIETTKQPNDFLSELKFWFGDDQRYNPDQGMPVDVIVKVCNRLSEWAGKHGIVENDDILLKSASIFKDVKEVVLASTETRITEPQLNRILDSVVGEGLEGPDTFAQAAPWSVVDTPSQIWGPADTVIWWNFTSSGTDPLHVTWTPDEMNDLAPFGVELKPTKDRRLREADYWRNAVKWAGKRLVLVAPISIAGTAVNFHPFWDEIRYVLDRNEKNTEALLFDASHLWREHNPNLIGHDINREPLQMNQLPEPQGEWEAPPGLIQGRPKESASSIQMLIGCPLAWVLKYVLWLKPGDLVSLPAGNTMLGTLCHAVIEKTFNTPNLPTPVDAAKLAKDYFDQLAPQMASPFLAPQRKPERDRVREKLALGAKKLAELIKISKLKIRGQEIERDKDFKKNQKIDGRIDLVLGDDTNDQVVVDLKWSGKSRYKRDELRQGQAVQLAVYAWLLAQAKSPFPSGAYYMLAQSELVSANCSFLPDECVFSDVDLEEIWKASVAAYDHRLQELHNGIARAEGVALSLGQTSGATNTGSSLPTPAPQTITLEPKCNSCAFSNLCGAGGSNK
jgi:RecB family exonuclease